MSNITWDKNGNPTIAFAEREYKGNKAGAIIVSATTPKTTTIKEETDNDLSVGSYKIVQWGVNNDFPNVTAQNYLSKSPALRSGIDYKIGLHVGQGLYAVKIKGYDSDGTEILESFFDPALDKFLRSYMVLNYRYQAYQNLFEYGNAFPQMIMSADNKKIAVIKSLDAPWCRFTKKNNEGIIEKCLVSGKWPDVKSADDYKVVNVLDIEGTEDEIIARAKQLKSFIYPISINTTGQIYYQVASWDTARASGHLDISIKIGEYLMNMFDNQMSIKYHIKIPYAYWEKKYPEADYKSVEEKNERKAKITADIDAIEENLTTTKNAKKAIITHFELNGQGKPEEKWEIDVIDDKFTSDQYLPQTAASNTEIFTSLGVHPGVKGLSLSGGPYANSEGGSNIREAFLVDNALSFLNRQIVDAPINLMAKINFNLTDDIVIKTRSTVLTTLDTGAGTKTIS